MWGFQQGFQWWMPMFGMGMMLFWVVVVGLIIWGVVRLAGGKTDRPDAEDTPLAILQKRLARGEITTEQFEELQDSILGSRQHV